MLAERLRVDVFSQPFQLPGKQIQLSACFGIASSNGRSPVVVLREAEKALCAAKDQGTGSIHCFGEGLETAADSRPSSTPTTNLTLGDRSRAPLSSLRQRTELSAATPFLANSVVRNR